MKLFAIYQPQGEYSSYYPEDVVAIICAVDEKQALEYHGKGNIYPKVAELNEERLNDIKHAKHKEIEQLKERLDLDESILSQLNALSQLHFYPNPSYTKS